MAEKYVSFRRLQAYHQTVNETLKGMMELTNEVLGKLEDEISALKTENESLKNRLKILEDTDFTTVGTEDVTDYENI